MLCGPTCTAALPASEVPPPLMAIHWWPHSLVAVPQDAQPPKAPRQHTRPVWNAGSPRVSPRVSPGATPRATLRRAGTADSVRTSASRHTSQPPSPRGAGELPRAGTLGAEQLERALMAQHSSSQPRAAGLQQLAPSASHAGHLSRRSSVPARAAGLQQQASIASLPRSGRICAQGSCKAMEECRAGALRRGCLLSVPGASGPEAT